MKLFSWFVLGLLVTAGATLAAMQSALVIFTPDSLHWVAATCLLYTSRSLSV